jgi:hypothetical protein
MFQHILSWVLNKDNREGLNKKPGNLAILTIFGFRPMALRPRLSTGLPLSSY